MTERSSAIVMFCMFVVLSGCASIDSKVAQDLRTTLMNTDEIGYGTGHGMKVDLLGKIDDKKKINEIVAKLRFGEGSEISSTEPFDRYIFFMNENRTMTTIRFEGAKIRYQGKEYIMNNETRDYLNRFYK
jgi:hypothetical protein